MVKNVVFIFLCSVSFFSFAQREGLDSLLESGFNDESRKVRISSLNMAAWQYFVIDNLDSTILLCDLAIKENSDAKFLLSLGITYYYKAIAHTRKVENDLAIKCYFNSLKISQISNDTSLMVYNANGLGAAHHNAGEYQKSLEYYKFTDECFLGLKDTFRHAGSLLMMSNCYIDLKKFDRAIKCLESAEKILTNYKETREYSLLLLGYSRYMQFKGDHKESLIYLELIESERQGMFKAEELMSIADGKAWSHWHLENYRDALPLAREAMALSKKYQYNKRYRDHLFLMSEIFKEMERWDSAYYYFDQYEAMDDSISSQGASEALGNLEMQFQSERNEKELAWAELALNDLEKITEEDETKFTQLKFIMGFVGIGLLALFVVFIQRRKAAQALVEKNEIIKQNLDEKEVLLGEIHHRVKNNLQLVSTMLELQTKNDSNPKFDELVKESTNRIQTMSLIHQVLYQYDDLSGIQMDNYIRNLIDKLHKAYNTGDVKNIFEIDEIKIGIDTAIPLALVINEVYTNSIKYAFDGEGTIRIALVDKTDHLELNISDNGKGYEKDKMRENFGSQLVKSFSRQLDATIEVITNLGQGTSTLIKINRFERV